MRHRIADRAAQDGVASLERLEDGSQGHRSLEGEEHLALDFGERAQMGGENNADHGRVWTSTDNTAGRSRTIGAQ